MKPATLDSPTLWTPRAIPAAGVIPSGKNRTPTRCAAAPSPAPCVCPPPYPGGRLHPVGQEPDCDWVRGCLVLGEPYGPEGTRPDLTVDPVTALDAPSDPSTF